ncbi:hypothetical protein A6B43_06090 [Vespertiliibacter pulmonis]|uniref:Transferrin binding protein n=1 Tax=Vespertiliibacter pulmonis TaxID=1443036 RepID=A0A3N4VLM2_9PAST|nr:Slam-dependent surface lipoprotein [Vespertiliibacter pulmonis]QLB21120.1 hypothetical protein A6B43_06090 [Vespertiliibacter pulmonis]RPE83778.1 transferrin binding protein [Vespertiliibacter pulmonis]
MKKVTKFSLAILSSLVLAACSSGGGSGDNHSNNDAKQNTKPAVKPESAKPAVKPESAKPAVKPTNTDNKLSINKEGTGAVYIISDMDNNSKVTHKVLNNADNLNLIVVDGKPIRVSYEDIGIRAGYWARVNGSASCCGVFNSVRFGVIPSNGPEEKDYIFYNGKVSKNVPTSGTASYTGQFVITGNAKQFDDEDYLFGDAKFKADFTNKQLKGSLEEASLKPIAVEAKIDGNAFSGSASSADFSTKANVEGKFFGENAKELGGIFDDGKNWGGAFGASK